MKGELDRAARVVLGADAWTLVFKMHGAWCVSVYEKRPSDVAGGGRNFSAGGFDSEADAAEAAILFLEVM